MNHEYNWEHHFQLSKEMFQYLEDNNPLPDNGKSAAISRSIIHLSYYACLNITKKKNLKYNLESQETGHGAHDQTIRNISKYEIVADLETDLIDLESDLLQLKKYRTHSDYKSDTQIDYYYVKSVFKIATDVYTRLIRL